MILRYFTNRILPCQKGFLLLEALVVLVAVTILMTTVASWYAHALLAQKTMIARIRATTAATSYLAQARARKTLAADTAEHAGYTIQTTVQKDQKDPTFMWVRMQVSAHKEPLVELVSGVVL